MKCPECKSTEIDSVDWLLAIGGQLVRYRKCRKCHYGWSCPDEPAPEVRGVEPTVPAMPAEIAAKPHPDLHAVPEVMAEAKPVAVATPVVVVRKKTSKPRG